MVGVGFLVNAVYRWRQFAKYGTSVLQLADVPGVIGGELVGVVRVPRTVEPRNWFLVRLSSVAARGITPRILWQDEQLVIRPLADGPAGTAIPVAFAVPWEAMPTSSTPHPGGPVEWRLEVEADTEGVGYWADFEVPVLRTAAGPHDQAAGNRKADVAEELEPLEVLRNAGIRVEPVLRRDGLRLIFPAARNLSIGEHLFIVFWTVLVWLVFDQGAFVLFLIFFGLIELVAVWHVLDVWLYRSVVEVSPALLKVRAGWFGLSGTREVTASQLRRLWLKRESSSGSYRILLQSNLIAELNNGIQVVLANCLQSQVVERTVIQELERGMGMRG